MITKVVLATKKAPSHHQDEAQKHTAVPPEFSAQSQHSEEAHNGALPYRVTSARVSPICSKGKCTTQRLCTTLSSVALSVKIQTQVGELYHRILYDIISHFFCFCKRFLKKYIRYFYYILYRKQKGVAESFRCRRRGLDIVGVQRYAGESKHD